MSQKRGRKTAGQLEAVTTKRPEPPEGLNENETAIWREVVSTLPAEWFTPETHRLLTAYCSHMDRFERISYKIDQSLERLKPNELSSLCKTAEIESRAAMSLATKMRITQQSTYRAETTRKKEPKKSSWANVANQR